jgi:hypothetical protein
MKTIMERWRHEDIHNSGTDPFTEKRARERGTKPITFQ